MRSVLGDRRAIAILLGPALTVYTLVILVPVFWSFGYTFFKGNPLEGFRFAGGQNFARLLHDPDIHSAFWFTLKYAVLMTILQVVFGYALALFYIFVLRRLSTLIRTLVFFPVVLPTVAIALLYQKIFQSAPRAGVVNELLANVGLSEVDWLGQSTTAFLVIVIMDVWRSVGFYGVLLYAGLLDIPEEVIESARIDGARRWSLFRSIILPLSLPILYSSVIFSINGTIKVFDSVIALTNGGPGNATTPLTLYMYRTAFAFSDYGYGSTIALLLTVMCLLVTLFIFRSARRDVTG
jgi:raffinose/stachyose/melibiose transport system permease protein